MSVHVVYGLLASGVGLLFLEFAVPGIGIFALGSLLSFLGALYYILGATSWALAIVTVVLALAIGLFWYAVKQFPHNPWLRRFTLRWTSSTEKGYVSNNTPTTLLGAQGVAQTVLRPAGTGRFGDQYIDVVTEGMYLPAGTPIQIIAVEGARTVVRAMTDTEPKA